MLLLVYLLFALFLLVGIVALLTWVVKTVWNAGNSDKQEHQYAGSRGASTEYRPSKEDMKWSPTGWYWDDKKEKWIPPDYKDAQANTSMPTHEESKKWVYNESARMFVDAEQMDPIKNRAAYERTRQKWQEYKEAEEAKDRAKWEARQRAMEQERHYNAVVEEKNRPVLLTPEEQELIKQIRINREMPTFEEWKAQQMKKTPDGEYRRDYVHIEQDDTVPKD